MTTEETALLICEKFQKEYPNKPIHETMLEIEGILNDFGESYHQAKLKEGDEKECECGGNKRVALDCTMKPCKFNFSL